MEDFDMNVNYYYYSKIFKWSRWTPVGTCHQAEEAIKSACEEFTVQGYDLTGIIKKVGGGKTEEWVGDPCMDSNLSHDMLDDNASAILTTLAL
jgi:hypothetical protein